MAERVELVYTRHLRSRLEEALADSPATLVHGPFVLLIAAAFVVFHER